MNTWPTAACHVVGAKQSNIVIVSQSGFPHFINTQQTQESETLHITSHCQLFFCLYKQWTALHEIHVAYNVFRGPALPFPTPQ